MIHSYSIKKVLNASVPHCIFLSAVAAWTTAGITPGDISLYTLPKGGDLAHCLSLRERKNMHNNSLLFISTNSGLATQPTHRMNPATNAPFRSFWTDGTRYKRMRLRWHPRVSTPRPPVAPLGPRIQWRLRRHCRHFHLLHRNRGSPPRLPASRHYSQCAWDHEGRRVWQ